MDFNDVLLIISMSDPSDIMGVLDERSLVVSKNLSFEEEQNVIEKLVIAYNYGYGRCIMTRDGTYINSEPTAVNAAV